MTMLILSILHIVAGAFWVGVVLFAVAFLDPVVMALGPAGAAFTQKLMGETRFPQVMPAAGGLTVLSGVIMFWLASDHLSAAWLGSAHGIAISAGAAAGLAAMVVGGILAKRPRMRMTAILTELKGKTPSPEQQQELAALGANARAKTRVTALLLLLALASMAAAHAL